MWEEVTQDLCEEHSHETGCTGHTDTRPVRLLSSGCTWKQNWDPRASQLADPYPPTFPDHRFGGSSTHLGVGGGNEQCWKGCENSYFVHTGQMRGFASHSASMTLRHCSSNCKLFSYSLMMDCSARQSRAGVSLHHLGALSQVLEDVLSKASSTQEKYEGKTTLRSLDIHCYVRPHLTGSFPSCLSASFWSHEATGVQLKKCQAAEESWQARVSDARPTWISLSHLFASVPRLSPYCSECVCSSTQQICKKA